jgi:multiple sugar transport system ATP-binding protein
LNHGHIQQVAPPRELYARPVNAFVAGFIGSPPMNFIRGRLVDKGIEVGGIEVALPPQALASLKGGDREVLVGLRPESFTADPGKDGPLRGEIEVVEQLGAESYIYLRVPGLDVVEQGDRPIELAGSICARLNEPANVIAGEQISLGIRPELVRIFDEKTGASRLPA